MLIRNVTKEDLYWALAQTNAQHNNNIKFRSIKQASGRTREGGEKWHVSLTVRDCHDRGGRYYPDTNRHVSSACWHAHGAFCDRLPMHRGVSIVTSVGGNYNTTGKIKTHPGDYWLNWDLGRRINRNRDERGRRHSSLQSSDACHCEGRWGRSIQDTLRNPVEV